MVKKNDEMILRGYKNGDEKQISRLFFNNFPDTLEPESICKTWMWQFQNSFSKDSGVSVAELCDEIVAHYAVMWFPMSYQGRRISGAVSTATVTDKKARGKGLFTKLAKRVFAEIETDGCKLVFGFPNSQSIRGFVKRLEWFEIAKFPLLIKPVNFSPFLNKFLGNKHLIAFLSFFMNRVYHFGFKLFNGWGQDRTIRIVTDVEGFSEQFSKIWKSCFASSKIAVARESAYLKWRYLDKPFSKYDIVTVVDENNEISGYMVIAMAVKKGLKVVYVMEIMARDDNKRVSGKLLKYLETYARERKADAISMLSLPNNPNKWLFYKYGFLPVPRKMFPQDIHFCARVNSEDIDSVFVKNNANWYISWGDLDVV